jgi:hypothetical protein
MKHTGPITLTIILALCGAAAAAQTGWQDDACDYKVTFDARKIDKAALDGTIDLLFKQQPVVLGGMYQTPEEAASADLGELQKKCSEAIDSRKSLKLLPLPGIEDYRTAVVEDLRDTCEREVAGMRALKDASALRDYKPAVAVCSEFIDALEGKTDFEQTFRKTNERSCQNNASPAACRNRTIADGQKPDGAERKRLFVLTFGWSNCAVNLPTVAAQDQKRKAQLANLEKAFRRQFKVARKCENPG